MITEGPRINLTLLGASVKEDDSHVAESCSMRQTNRRENYVHARGDSTEGSTRGGRGRRTGNVFKFMAAFKTPSANGRGLQRATAGEEGGELQRRERGSLEGNREVEGRGGLCLMHSDAWLWHGGQKGSMPHCTSAITGAWSRIFGPDCENWKFESVFLRSNDPANVCVRARTCMMRVCVCMYVFFFSFRRQLSRSPWSSYRNRIWKVAL